MHCFLLHGNQPKCAALGPGFFQVDESRFPLMQKNNSLCTSRRECWVRGYFLKTGSECSGTGIGCTRGMSRRVNRAPRQNSFKNWRWNFSKQNHKNRGKQLPTSHCEEQKNDLSTLSTDFSTEKPSISVVYNRLKTRWRRLKTYETRKYYPQ